MKRITIEVTVAGERTDDELESIAEYMCLRIEEDFVIDSVNYCIEEAE